MLAIIDDRTHPRRLELGLVFPEIIEKTKNEINCFHEMKMC